MPATYHPQAANSSTIHQARTKKQQANVFQYKLALPRLCGRKRWRRNWASMP